jgi:hypothetical protein
VQGQDVIIMLLCNQIDLEERRQGSVEEDEKKARDFKVIFIQKSHSVHPSNRHVYKFCSGKLVHCTVRFFIVQFFILNFLEKGRILTNFESSFFFSSLFFLVIDALPNTNSHEADEERYRAKRNSSCTIPLIR